MKEESVVARKLIKDHMLAQSPSPESFVGKTTHHIRKYQEHLEPVKNAKEQEKVSNEIKVLMEEINDAEANCEKSIKVSESLDNDFVSCIKKAEFEKDATQISSLISKADILK